jgi:hypothetical protein
VAEQDWGGLVDPAVVAGNARAAAAAGANRAAAAALFSPEWEAAVDALRRGDADAVEPAVVFLEVDPFCLFSGYEKERLYGYLSHVSLTDDQADRLRRFVLRRCREKRYRHELRRLRVLARAIATPELMAELRALPRSAEPDGSAEEAFLRSVEQELEQRVVEPSRFIASEVRESGR